RHDGSAARAQGAADDPDAFLQPFHASAFPRSRPRELDGGNERNPFAGRLQDDAADHAKGDGAARALGKPAMLSTEQNELITRTGPGTPAGRLMRCYWQPAALVDELAGNRPVKPVRLLGESLVAFRDEQGPSGLIERACPHRGTDLAFGRLEDGGLRCAFHGWLFDVAGQCLETPAEPEGSRMCENIRQRAYP